MRDFEEGMRKSAHKAFPDAQKIGESLQYSWDKKKQKLTTVLLPAEQRKGEENDVTVLWYDKEFLLQFDETKLGMDRTYNSRPNIYLGR
ncbi:hypothetical protein TSAR_007710 [Trichomalopsis sarcophagae]|uniref:Uncharacterized protein n=1 Tax=Trichomalopsis sarcophagae TaxID=543379 RepID=A0A232ED24_9HYME|nr:hypothetical protein TSAR_007710 [Trichomalopsis sarcophagae]